MILITPSFPSRFDATLRLLNARKPPAHVLPSVKQILTRKFIYRRQTTVKPFLAGFWGICGICRVFPAGSLHIVNIATFFL